VSRHLSLVFADAAPGRDDDFNAWYGGHHLREALDNLPGLVAAQRYRLSPSQPARGVPAEWGYLTVYELDTDDVGAFHAGYEDFKAAGGFTPHDGALAEGHATWVYTEARPRVAEPDVAAASKPRLGEGRHVFIALTNPQVGREEDFSRWYDIHIPEIVAHYPGLVTGQLFRSADLQRAGMTPRWGYMALYDLEATDVADYVAREPQGDSRMTSNAGSLAPGSAVWIYTELGSRVLAAPAAAHASAGR
jgi:hypothetical protein